MRTRIRRLNYTSTLIYKFSFADMHQRWTRSWSPATFFGSGFEFLGKTGFDIYGMMYIACV